MSQSLTIQNVADELSAIGPQIAALLPPDISLDRFRSVALAAIRQKPDLLRCNQQSLFSACLAAAQDGLLPDGREGAIVPRKGLAVWQPMIGGIFKRVKTSGSVASLSANVVYEGEQFAVLLGDEDRIVHQRDLALVKPGHEVAVYAIAKLKDGSKEREIMTWEQVMTVRQASAMPNSGPWTDWPDEMARKTVVRRLAKRLPVLEQGDEALHRTIERVDQLYDFGNQRIEAPAPSPAPLRAAASPMPKAPRVAEKAPPAARTDEQWRVWIDKLRAACAVLYRRSEVVEIGDRPSVGDAIANGPAWVQREVSAILAENYKRFPEEPGDEPLDDLEIVGEEKLAAGD
jgi:recombination protein RecT